MPAIASIQRTWPRTTMSDQFAGRATQKLPASDDVINCICWQCRNSKMSAAAGGLKIRGTLAYRFAISVATLSFSKSSMNNYLGFLKIECWFFALRTLHVTRNGFQKSHALCTATKLQRLWSSSTSLISDHAHQVCLMCMHNSVCRTLDSRSYLAFCYSCFGTLRSWLWIMIVN